MPLTEQDWKTIAAQINADAAREGIPHCEWILRHLFMLVDERQNPPKPMRFVPSFVQQQFLRAMHYLTDVLKARQHGISSLQALLILYFCLFRLNYRAGIIDRTDQEARKKLQKIRYAYDHMDDAAVLGEPMAALGAALKQAMPLIPPSNEHTLTWANGSNVYAATSLRGGTINYLWISEFGKIAADDPKRAAEIMAGSLESVHPGNIAVIESTHEGGRYGENFRMIRLAQKSPKTPSLMQWKLLFFPWQSNPAYSLPLSPGETLKIPAHLLRYFAELEKKSGTKLSDAQKNWYVQKSAVQRDMARQYPGTVEEALNAQVEGAIYGEQIALLRAQGRVCDFACDGAAPLWTFWDIGMSDFTAIWLVQFVGFDIHALDYHTGNGMTPAEHAAQLLRWERVHQRPITLHYLPHDANNRGQSGKTYVDLLREAGVANVKVVPRTPDLWAGINALRAILPRFYFHGTNCERETELPTGIVLPSGLGAMEGYRRKVEANEGGAIVELPLHNEASHGASALRTLAEAHARGMLTGVSAREVESRRAAGGPKTALMGLRRAPVTPELHERARVIMR